MPTTREVEAARVERMRRRAEANAAAAAAKPRNARERRIAEAHARATAPARWLCRVDGCPDPGPHPAESRDAALADADRHYADRHYQPDPPADLEQARAAWVAAGRPPLGRHTPRHVGALMYARPAT